MAPMMSLGGLPFTGQAFAETPAPLGLVEGNQGRHIEGMTQKRMANLGQARVAVDAAAGLSVLWIESGKGRDLTGVDEPSGVRTVRRLG